MQLEPFYTIKRKLLSSPAKISKIKKFKKASLVFKFLHPYFFKVLLYNLMIERINSSYLIVLIILTIFIIPINYL